VLGAMAELGKESLREHQMILEQIRKYKWANVILVGGDFEKLSTPYRWFKNSSEAGTWFRQQHFQNCTILIKGSRSMQMEKVAEE
jgi:UDP-N-acetylmuramoyl-tripeptide--D-alanyl-D-alanine ligase